MGLVVQERVMSVTFAIFRAMDMFVEKWKQYFRTKITFTQQCLGQQKQIYYNVENAEKIYYFRLVISCDKEFFF